MAGKTLFQKIWDNHVVVARDDGKTLLYVDRQLLPDWQHRAFDALVDQGRTVRKPKQNFAMPDHSVPTTVTTVEEITEDVMRVPVEELARHSKNFGVVHFDLTDERHGIVHVVGPEQGITLPGLIVVCGDSHTSTNGALGCIAFGIGTSEVEHVLATQTIWQEMPKQMRVNIEGELGYGVTAKDVILAVIGKIGTAGGTGYAIEFAGSAISAMSMEGRMTMSNMTIEAGARFGLMPVDDKAIDYVKDRPYAPSGEKWGQAVSAWRDMQSDDDAVFDREVTLDASEIAPMVSWGTSPQDVIQVTDNVPDPAQEGDSDRKTDIASSLEYMDLKPGMAMTDIKVDKVFVGACTNARIEDLRAAAAVAKGRKAQVETLIVPGSGLVKKQAEAEGLDKIFIEAGMEWRQPGCSMCCALNGDIVGSGERVAATNNRNFRGRQGPGSRTHLVSPTMAVAASVTGRITDVRKLMEEA
jgi:3-isopropylmalate/(R)-2-methylmalate dehydratase large subunit